jgi:hypothetical protein
VTDGTVADGKTLTFAALRVRVDAFSPHVRDVT